MELRTYYKVYPLPEKTNIPIKKHENIKKSIKMLDFKILIALLIIFGKYVTISSSKKISIFIRIFCMCTSLMILCISFNLYLHAGLNARITIFAVGFATQYLLCGIFSQITSHRYLSTYTRTILTCDSLMAYKNKAFLAKYALIFLLINTSLTFINIFCDLHFSKVWADKSVLYTITSMFIKHYLTYSLTLVPVTIAFVVAMLQNRIMLLRQILENNTVPVTIVSRIEKMSTLRVVQKCLINYNHLLDAFDAIDSQMQLSMIFNLLLNTPFIVLLSYNFLKSWLITFENSENVLMEITCAYTSMIGPCILCELCYSEMDKLKAVLTRQLIKCSDAELRVELQKALDCVTRRPFNFQLLRALRVDMQLPIAIFALIITYTILLIQFTHFAF